MFYGEDAPPVTGLVHSHEQGMVEAVAKAARFPIRRIELDEPLDDFFFDPDYRHLLGSARDGDKAVVVNLNVRREIAELPLPGMPHLGSGISWQQDGRRVMATPHLKEAAVSIIDMETLAGGQADRDARPGLLHAQPREHALRLGRRVLRAAQGRDARHRQAARSRSSGRSGPEPGKTAAHVEFTRDGRFALVSIWEMDGAIVVYDAATLEEVKRIPMVKPSGKYNVWNKIHGSEGTSH